MAAKKKEMASKTEPTKSELEILQVLWEHGPSTVRFVNDHLNAKKRAVQYTGTLKLMQIMAEKGILKRDESNMKHVYKRLCWKNKRLKVFCWNVLWIRCTTDQQATC